MAKSTWEGSKEPEVHAEPLEPQIPCLSSQINMDSPSINRKQKLALPGSLFCRSPFKREWGISAKTLSMR